EVFDRRVGQAGGHRLLADVLGRGREARRALNAMESSELADRLESRDSVDLGMNRGRHLVVPERDRPRLCDERGCTQQTRRDKEGPARPPLPPGEGWGEGKARARTNLRRPRHILARRAITLAECR